MVPEHNGQAEGAGTQLPGNLITERYRQKGRMSREQAIRIQPLSLMKTSHEWMAERQRQQCEGMLLNADGRLKGMSPANPLPRDSAVNKNLSRQPKPPTE
jgi:hypothetical protein